ncbi:UNVERIFIED_CONTAM: hypothetical protein PYX00_004997 [Menopon gallinae]|uniref:Uncharacterized protein n=1 Tax=Menopon gallinae TaxID=328185 RepID=A0AAW2I8V1_9NEOP
MQLLVSNFRKKNSELRKERPSCPSSLFHTWETLLQEVEIDSQAHTDIASILGRQVSRPLLEKSFFRKIQSRKVFSHRETYENMIKQNEDKLGKTRIEYKTAYLAYMNSPSTQALANYINSHNEYVGQLHMTNGMLSQYHSETLPMLLQEIEDIYNDLCVKMSDSVLQGAEMISTRVSTGRAGCRNGVCVRVLTVPAVVAGAGAGEEIRGTNFAMQGSAGTNRPGPPGQVRDRSAEPPAGEENVPPVLKNEIVVDRLANIQIKERLDAMKKDCSDLEAQIKQLTDALHTLTRVQQRSVDSNLFNKVNELQEDISVKQCELNVALIRLAGIRAQKELFSSKIESAETGRDRKMSASSTGSMKSKWMKAFKSLKTPPSNGTASKEADKKNQMYHAVSTILAMRKNGKDGAAAFITDPTAHSFQDHTYKKITPCDVCSQVLRGHTRQGLKCRICKLNVHVDCQDKAPKCQQKSRLLRRQKSTSEIDTKVHEPHQEEEGKHGSSHFFKLMSKTNVFLDEMDTAQRRRLFSGFKSFSVFGGKTRGESPSHRSISLPETTDYVVNNVVYCLFMRLGNIAAPHSPRRQKLNLRMKSLSLDSPESTEQAQKRRAQASHSGGHSSQSSSSKIHCMSDKPSTDSASFLSQAPSSPVHNRRLLSARNMRMSSVELPDDNEKSLSSASTSPCPSPLRVFQKPHRLLPTNLYVVLYNFKSRRPDELDLKAGYKVTVMDSNDPDWWKGKCLGRVGYFPSKYVMKLEPGERPLQVTHNLQVQDGDTGLMLLRDQIVIQVGEDIDGMVMIRNADNKQGACPLKFLQEV